MPAEKTNYSSKNQRVEFKEMRRKRRQQQRLLITGVVVVAALALLGLMLAPAIQEATAPVGEIVTVAEKVRPQAEQNAMGDPNAPVKIEEFSDFQCPYCKLFSDETEQQIVENYVATGKVYFVYRSMGEFIGPESVSAMEAALCAGEQAKFWQYHDILFANWQGENVGSFSNKRLLAFGTSLGLDINALRSCITSNKYENQITQDQIAGENYGIKSTPSFVINGELKIIGASPFQKFQQEIEAALASVGASE